MARRWPRPSWSGRRRRGPARERPPAPARPPEVPSLLIAEARVICALIAAGWSWDVEVVRGALTEALAELRRLEADFTTLHPLAAIAEPMMALYDGDQEVALSAFERYLT